MPFVSLTRLRVRSLRYLAQFVWQALKTGRQAETSAGFLGGRLLRESKNTFWTITAWEDEAAMRAYRNAGAHRAVMPRLLDWCDEAAIAHWNQESPELPEWLAAHRRMMEDGRSSKVNHPSPAHTAHQFPVPRPGRISRALKPARQVKTPES